MSKVVVLVWLGASSLRAAHEPDLASWADAHLVTLEDLSADAPLPPLDHDDATASRVEDLVAEARATGELGEAKADLDDAEALLRAHAELPESAWLMAEIFRTRAALLAPGSPEDAAALERRADDLEGARAAPFDAEPAARARENGKRAGPPPAVPASPAPGDGAVSDGHVRDVAGLMPTDDVYVDGTLERRSIPASGEHHVRIVRGTGLAWAGWTDAAGLSRVRIPGAAPCSAADLAAVEESGAYPVLRHSVACPEWAIATASGENRVEIARCHASDCGTFLPWKRDWGKTFEMPVHPRWPEPKSNSWIVWTATSIAAVAVTGVVLWRAGVFEKAPERQTAFVLQGPGPGRP